MNDDKDYLLISQLTQAGYCLRRAALIMNEQIWKESADTAHMERRGKERRKGELEMRVRKVRA